MKALAPILLALAAPAAAQDAYTSPPESALSLSGSATLLSDYRFRGISSSNNRPALQGTLTASHRSGLFASAFASTLADYAAREAEAELDLIAGYSATRGGTTVEVGATYYVYPGARGDSDYVEPYASVSHLLGPVTARVSASYAPHQRGLTGLSGRRDDGLYLAADASGALPNGLGLSARLGRSFGASPTGARENYTDWSLGATYQRDALALGLSYVDTDTRVRTPAGRNISGATFVLSAAVRF